MSTFEHALMKTSPSILVVVDAMVALIVVPVPGKILKKLAAVRATEATPRTVAKAVATALGSTLGRPQSCRYRLRDRPRGGLCGPNGGKFFQNFSGYRHHDQCHHSVYYNQDTG